MTPESAVDDSVIAVDAVEAARRLSFSPGKNGKAGSQKVLKLIRDGRLRGVLIGKSMRIYVEDLHAFMRSA